MSLYTLSGDELNGSPLLITSSNFAVSTEPSSNVKGDQCLVIDFTKDGMCSFTQTNSVVTLDFFNLGSVELSNVTEVKFKGITVDERLNSVLLRAQPISTQSVRDYTTIVLYPCVWGTIEYLFQPISDFLDKLVDEYVEQTTEEIENLYIERGAFRVYLRELNTDIYSEIAADLLLKPVTQNAVATFKVTPNQMNGLFVFNNEDKTVRIRPGAQLESVFGQSWTDTFMITYTDLLPDIRYPNLGPTDNVITDLQKALFRVILPNVPIVPSNFTSLLANPGSVIQSHFNNGIQLKNLVVNYFQNNPENFYDAIKCAYLNSNTFTKFQIGDVIEWKVTILIEVADLGAPGGSLSGRTCNEYMQRIYLFQMLVEKNNFAVEMRPKYKSLVKSDDTAVGIFNTMTSHNFTHPTQYVNLGNSAYVASKVSKDSVNYAATAFFESIGANVIGDIYY